MSVNPSPCDTPTIPDTIAAIIKTIIEKSLNWSKNLCSKVFFFAACNSLYPYFSCFSLTCSSDKPFSILVSSLLSTSSTFCLYHFFSSIIIQSFLFIIFIFFISLFYFVYFSFLYSKKTLKRNFVLQNLF